MCVQNGRPIWVIAIVGISLTIGLGIASPGAHAANEAAPASVSREAQSLSGKEAQPATTKDPQIALDDLELILEPMTKDEIETEAKGWFALLRGKEREISLAELDVHRKNREIAQLEKQNAAAADLAKASQAAKAADDGVSLDKEKTVATERLANAQKKLAQTVETANKATAKEETKAEAATAALAKQADATPAPSSPSDSVPAAPSRQTASADSDDPILQKTAEAADRRSEENAGKRDSQKIAAAADKEAAASNEIKSLAQAAPAAAGAAVSATVGAPEATNEAVSDASKKAEKLADKAKEAAASKTDVKVQLVDLSTQLMSERTALVDRVKLVLDKWELKGGDPKSYRMYIASIGGIKIDVTDQAATWARLTTWLSADEGGLRWARNIATFAGYILGSIIVAWIARMILRRVMGATHATSQLLRDFIIVSSGRVIVAIGVLLALSALEVNLAPLLAVIGAAGFVVAFALQGTLSNFASGLLIMVFKPFDDGDQVEVAGGIKGRVNHVTIFSTYIRVE
jgi:small conductance mechanosensitive channel